MKILVVDDEEHMRDSCRQMLSRRGHNVKVAADGNQSFKIMADEEFDIVILDLKMPGISGMEVLKRIKSDAPETIVIVVTGYATVESAVEAMKLGAYDFLPKPFNPDEMNAIIKRAEEKRKIVIENIYLREQLKTYLGMDEIIGESEQIIEIKELIRKVAPTDSTVLISGESGTGKELVARAIHHYSDRKNKPFVTVDCGSLVETLFESELFGHAKGSFTGASDTKYGKFEIADTGTIFIDEIANINMNIQSKMLRVIQEREISKVGSTKTVSIDIRIISATNKNLLKEIKDGNFREDLFYRLSVVPIHLPPLRERKDDIPVLSNHFLSKYNKKRGKLIKGISERAMKALINCEWPGNVRELENTIERAVVLTENEFIQPADLSYHGLKAEDETMKDRTLADIERTYIEKMLKIYHGHKAKTAKVLGIDRKTLRTKMKKYGLGFEE